MKRNIRLISMMVIVLALGFVVQAGALVTSPSKVAVTLQTNPAGPFAPGSQFELWVVASDVEYSNGLPSPNTKVYDLAASALGISYNKNVVTPVPNTTGDITSDKTSREANVGSDLFVMVTDTRTTPNPTDYPRVGNNVTSGARGLLSLAGANSGGLTFTAPYKMFKVKFQVSQTAASQTYTEAFYLEKTIPPANTNTGWNGTAAVDPLMGVWESWNTTTDISDDFMAIPQNDANFGSAAAISITVAVPADSDNDGIPDSWEIEKFGNLTTANATSDFDYDGYTDKVEYQNNTDPMVANAQNGTGYNNKTDVRVYNADIDLNGVVAGGTDGIMAIRYMYGGRGASLIAGVTAANCQRCLASEIEAYIAADNLLDIDGNGSVAGGSDGILLIRYLYGGRGAALINGVIGAGATRTTSDAIEAYIRMIGFM